jgi:uncharacterized protein (TIGR02646 family)
VQNLDRGAVPTPGCLANYGAGSSWENLALNRSDYRQVVEALDRLQGTRCAYCECSLSNEGSRPHVEHFEQRSRAPHKTFDWSNLFRSCSHKECCGKHKDAHVGTYADGNLIKPDVENPREFLEFDSAGGIAPRRGVNEQQRVRAEETIRVFNLTARRLVSSRRAYLVGPRSVLDAAVRDLGDDPIAIEHIDAIAADYRSSAFSAAILDLFGIAP